MHLVKSGGGSKDATRVISEMYKQAESGEKVAKLRSALKEGEPGRRIANVKKRENDREIDKKERLLFEKLYGSGKSGNQSRRWLSVKQLRTLSCT